MGHTLKINIMQLPVSPVGHLIVEMGNCMADGFLFFMVLIIWRHVEAVTLAGINLQFKLSNGRKTLARSNA